MLPAAELDRLLTRRSSTHTIDSMPMSAPWTRVNFGGVQTNQKGSGERSRYADCRMRLSPGLQQIAFVDTATCEIAPGFSRELILSTKTCGRSARRMESS